MQLLFEGGPWAGQLLDSSVTSAPEIVAPDVDRPGIYLRAERTPESPVLLYEWLPNGLSDREPGRRARRHGRSRERTRVSVDGDRGKAVRFAVEVVGGLSSFALAIVTVFWQDWLEIVLRINPDAGNGDLEWAVVFAFAAISIGLALAARHDWRRLRIAA